MPGAWQLKMASPIPGELRPKLDITQREGTINTGERGSGQDGEMLNICPVSSFILPIKDCKGSAPSCIFASVLLVCFAAATQ